MLIKERVRRFDIFAIFNYLNNVATMDENKAKGDAIWLAKYTAHKKQYGGAKKKKTGAENQSTEPKENVQVWKTLSDIPQTNLEYDKAIVDRFGDNYPAIEKTILSAIESGLDYTYIRDCEHATGGRNTGWCKECSKNFVQNFETKFAGELVNVQ